MTASQPGNHAAPLPHVSIGMPVYNGEAYLRQALDALLGQAYADWELVISDNASTDATEEICRAYAARDARIRYYRNPTNLGAAANYNRVFHLSRGEYFRWAAHDDLCAPEHLARCADVLDRCPEVALCYPQTLVIDAQGTVIGGYEDNLELAHDSPVERYRQYHAQNRIHRECNAIFGLIRASVLATTSLIGRYTASDMILLGELALRGRIHEVPEPLFYRRDHPNTSVRSNPSLMERSAWFDPAKRGKVQLTHWTWLWQYLSAVERAPLRRREKLLCHLETLRWAATNRVGLKADLALAVSRFMHRSRLGSGLLSILRRARQSLASGVHDS